MAQNSGIVSTMILEPALFKCDRRLSRAAREMVHRRVLPLLPTSSSSSRENNDLDTLRDSIRDASTCILHPDRDVLLGNEVQSIRIPAGSSRHSPRRDTTTNLQRWYQCGICGKTFLTRYYLDLHFEHAHLPRQEEGKTKNVCPAVDYCHALGGCDQVALELEPFYGRGSGGAGPDGPQVRQYWQTKTYSEPCNDHTLQHQVRPACEAMMRECFSERVAKMLMVSVCDTITCHHRLHQLAGHVLQHAHSWKSEWDEHHRVSVGWMGILVMIAVGVYYLCLYRRLLLRTPKPTTRLLNKKPSSSSSWFKTLTKKKKKLH